jgi:hypothetical protein
MSDLMKQLQELTKKTEFKDVQVVRTGEKLILPEGMTYDQGIEWLERRKREDERMVRIHHTMKAFPYDGANALFEVCREEFGFAESVGKKGPSGVEPPQMIGITLHNGSTKKVPWGRIQFPGFDEDEYIVTDYDSETMSFVIRGEVRKKHEDLVVKVANLTKSYLAVNSIYKGHSFKVDLSFIGNSDIRPKDPEFMNVSKITEDDVILSSKNLSEYKNILFRIENSEKCIKHGVPLKHGCILAGKYGTGKTLLAKYTAKQANTNGWTFIYVEKADQVKNALRLAQVYAPAVVFCEDIDQFAQDRTKDGVNEMLNTLDGIDTKDAPIISIFTTNHLENINSTLMRAGRIDTCVVMDPLNEVTGLKFIERFARNQEGESMLDPNADYQPAAEALAGVVPAFAMDIVTKAKTMTFVNDEEFVTPKLIINATEISKEHQRLATPKKTLNELERVGKATKELVGSLFTETEEIKKLDDNVKYISDNF